ncbi:MAG: T9SS type A sorting domain-containing protein [Bacteroidia bacterium]|nr:T9SS type A sorting domain-containing protein [Bacteroidia bacterium]
MKHLYFLLITLFLSSTLSSQNVNISNGNVFDGEPFIAINPTNAQNIVIAWQGYVFGSGTGLTIKVKSSFNGGQTWSSAVNMPHIQNSYKSADPSMAFDNNGNLFLSYIDHRESPDSGGVYVAKSINGGLSWSTPVKAIDAHADGTKLPVDRPFIAVSSDGSKIYITTKPAPWVPAPNRPYFVCSTNGGTTWLPWRYVDSTGYSVGSLIAAPFSTPTVAANNKFHTVYPSYVPSQNILPQFILASSTNNGTSMTYKNVYASNSLANNDSAKLAYQLIADPTNSNHLALFFPQNIYGDIDIMMIESYNDGSTWTSPVRINDDATANGKMQDMLWAGFDNDGDIIVSWRDRRNANGSGFITASEFYAAYRNKDSVNFAPNFMISDSLVAYHNILAQDGNDFMSVAMVNDTLSATWANTRDGSLDVWYVRMHAPTATVTQMSLVESSKEEILIFPNPTNGIFKVESKNRSRIEEINIYDIQGKLIRTEQPNSTTTEINISTEKKGTYIIHVRSNGKTSNGSVIKN